MLRLFYCDLLTILYKTLEFCAYTFGVSLFLYNSIWRRLMRPYYIAGPGNIAPAHIDALQLRGRELNGVSSRTDKVRGGDMSHLKCNMGPVGKHMIIRHPYYHLSRMCSDMDHDGIVICTLPTNLHHSAGVTAASHNRHCLMEKPFCSSSDGAADVIAAYENSSGKLAVNHILPLFSEYEYLCTQLKTWGRETTKLNLTRLTARSETENANWVKAVGGNAPDLLAHDGHLAIMCFGMPRKVTVHEVEWMYGVPVYMQLTLGYPITEVNISCGSPEKSLCFQASYMAWRSNGDGLYTTESGKVQIHNGDIVDLKPRSVVEVFAKAHETFEEFIDGKRDNLGPLCPKLALQTVQLIEYCVAACSSPGTTIDL